MAKKKKTITQADLVIEYMEQNGSITTFEAFKYLGITRLAARICNLKKLGYNIKTEDRKIGMGRPIAVYSLAKED